MSKLFEINKISALNASEIKQTSLTTKRDRLIKIALKKADEGNNNKNFINK